MVKTLFFIIFLSLSLKADIDLDTGCLNCHKKEGIPTDALYKRYLLKYSSQKQIKTALFRYLKNPTLKTSIMPAPFIHKFGLQKPTSLPDNILMRHIEAFMNRFDVRGQLYLPNKEHKEVFDARQ